MNIAAFIFHFKNDPFDKKDNVGRPRIFPN